MTVDWIDALIFLSAVVVIAARIHRHIIWSRWNREGEILHRQFMFLMDDQKRMLDCGLREIWDARLDLHQHQRREWLERMP